ncbi:MAG: hypothetical protein M1832_001178 [Thelocarpon impressellum]|nr:MAG: hypothetical protein M1832_001178 [Thelocarpon impressellum]
MSTKSRAERFEDEKRRIIETCFAKKDDDGSLLESYITHIRILEDAAHPSAAPPPDSPPENKKPRLIIVAVRKSGRVRMHKARENANGTFSIGKTWVLDDLTAIQSFTGVTSATIEEEQQKSWAGGVGFIVTVLKPYYWQAGTPKEKEFFIASLVKIYKKYTGGKVPDLLGFDAKEKEQMLGVQSSRGPTPDAGRGEPPSMRDQPPRKPSDDGFQAPYGSRNGSVDSRNGGGVAGNGAPVAQRMFKGDSNGESGPFTSPESRGDPWASPRSIDQTIRSPDPTPGGVDEPSPRVRTPKVSIDEGKNARSQLLEKASFKSDRSGRSSPSSANVTSPPPETPDEDSHRPGLGPMIKPKSKRDLAGAFRKAANTYGAFKPRAGGAGDRLREEPESVGKSPDGISGVVPAPSLLRGASHESSAGGAQERRAPVLHPPEDTLPEVTITATSPGGASDYAPMPSFSPPRARSPSPKRIPRRDSTARHVAALGIPPGLLGSKTGEIQSVLQDFATQAGNSARLKSPQLLEAELRRELGRVEAGSWLGYLEQPDARVESVERALDAALRECEELEGLLTLYSVELSTLNDDVAFIESQSQGLQVQTANQKRLQAELQARLNTR